MPVVNAYELSEDGLLGFKVLRFEEAGSDWVEFVCACRRGGDSYRNYDVVVGCVADDKVYEAVNMYFKGYWDIEATLEALKYYEKNDQYCFVSQAAVDNLLTFLGSCEVTQ